MIFKPIYLGRNSEKINSAVVFTLRSVRGLAASTQIELEIGALVSPSAWTLSFCFNLLISKKLIVKISCSDGGAELIKFYGRT